MSKPPTETFLCGPFFPGPLPSRLQEEIEFLAAQEVTIAFRNVEAAVELTKTPAGGQCSSRMAIAPTSGPNGEIYTVYVSVWREPPRE